MNYDKRHALMLKYVACFYRVPIMRTENTAESNDITLNYGGIPLLTQFVCINSNKNAVEV